MTPRDTSVQLADLAPYSPTTFPLTRLARTLIYYNLKNFRSHIRTDSPLCVTLFGNMQSTLKTKLLVLPDWEVRDGFLRCSSAEAGAKAAAPSRISEGRGASHPQPYHLRHRLSSLVVVHPILLAQCITKSVLPLRAPNRKVIASAGVAQLRDFMSTCSDVIQQ
jgi:hypothetical protein